MEAHQMDGDLPTPSANIQSDVVGPVSVVPRCGSKHPTPGDWERWKIWIISSYKHRTAQAIMDAIRNQDFYVTYVSTLRYVPAIAEA